MRLFVIAWLVLRWLPGAVAHDWSDALPALKTLPAPAEIRTGIRLSYYGSAGDIPNENVSKWDPASDSWTYATAPSGHGFTQVDVVGISDGFAGLTVQGWHYSNWTGPLIPTRGGQRGLVCHAGGGDWWIHPEVLAGLQEFSTADFAVIRVTQTLDGISHPAIRIQRTLPDSRQASVYDLRTGLLLFQNSAVQTAANTTFASQMFFKGSRLLPFAGHGAAIPYWLRTGLQLDYRGSYTAHVAGGFPFTLPLAANIQVEQVSAAWFLYRQTTTLSSLQGLPPTVETASLVGGGTLFLDPTALQNLPTNPLLDTDPITGARLEVVGRSPQIVLLASVGNVSFTEFTYDPNSGLMTRFHSWDSTDPLYSLDSELVLERLPDLTLPPRLAIRRQGKELLLACPEGAGFELQCSEDGGRTWRALAMMTAEKTLAWDPTKGCVLYRLGR